MQNKSRNLIIFFGLLIIVQIIWIFNSNGFYFIDDSCHFNYNRNYFTKFYLEPFSAWSRFGRVILFAIPSLVGLKGVQIFSSLIFLLTIVYAYKIAKLKNINNPEWIVLLIGFQSVLFNISYTVLAELPAAALIVISYYYYMKDKQLAVLVLSSLIFLFRTEYYFVCVLYFIIYVVEKKWKLLPLVIIGPLVWYLHTYFISQNPLQFYYDFGLHARLPRITVGIEWYYYFLRSPQIFGIVQTLFFAISLFFVLKNKVIKDYYIPILIVFGGIIFHTLAALKGLNVSCSVGQLRYVAVIGPMFGIVSLFGLDEIMKLIRKIKTKYYLSIVIVLIMFLSGPFVTPFHKKLALEEESDKVVELVNSKYVGYKVLSSLHYVANSLDEPTTGGEVFKELTKANFNKYDKSIIVFLKELENDPFVSETMKLRDIENNPNVKLLYTVKAKVNRNNDVPVNKYFYDWVYEFLKTVINYLVADQYSWEDFELKVYLKD